MKEVLELIEEKKQEFAKLPFFTLLANESIEPMKRLAWAPYMAFFAMSFKDINAYALRREVCDDPIQTMINNHSYEDGRHWRWYLEDIKKLDLDKTQNFTEHLKFLWSEETQQTRYLCHNLFALLVFEKDPIIKLVVIEAIEATGVVALPLFAKLGNQLQEMTQKRYSYFSASHAKVETGHILSDLDTNDTEKFLEQIQLTEEQKSKAIQAIETVFDGYTQCTNEMVKCIEKYLNKEVSEQQLFLEEIETRSLLTR